jgi:small subunit ribosomal protein S24e
MDLHVMEKKRNELLRRNEVVAKGSDKTIPSKDTIKQKLGALLDAKSDCLVIQKVDTRYGDQNYTVYAKLYDTSDQMKKVEQKHILKRNFKDMFAEKKAEISEAPASFKK